MKNLFKITIIAALAIVSFQACDDSAETITQEQGAEVTKKEVVENYAKMVAKNYKDSYDDAVKMQGVIKAFTDNPSQETLDAAKKAWLEARESYGVSEVYRGSGGPIDTEGALNTEGQINAWPLNEAYIDYVAGKGDANTGTYDVSIIAGTENITAEALAGLNEAGDDEKAVATGWHAIEFLLWGQDNTAPSEKKPGQRPFTDYTENENKDRRIQYLTVVTELLVKDLKDLADTWAEGGTYYKEFMALDTDKALNNVLNGPYFLAFSELSEERMLAPAKLAVGENGQEDEHSCFSDNTHRDVFTNAEGIYNVLEGTYGDVKGKSFIELVKMKDEAQAKKLEEAVAKSKASIKAIDDKAKAGTPFDVMIMEESVDAPGLVINAHTDLRALGTAIKESAALLGIETVLPE